MAAARPAAAAEVQLRAVAVEVQLRAVAVEVQLRAVAVAVEERGAPPEAAEAAGAPRLEAAVEARGAPQDAEAEPLGAPPLEAAVEATDAPRLEAAMEALGARLEGVEVEAPGAPPRPEVGLEVRGAPMAALVVGPAAVTVGQSPARRLALAEAVARAVRAAVALVVLTIVPAASQRLQHLASVVRMALSSAPVEAVFRAAVSVGQSPARRLAPAEAVARAVPAAVVLTTVPAASQRLQHLASVARMALSSAPTQPVGLAVVPTGAAVNREQLSGTDLNLDGLLRN